MKDQRIVYRNDAKRYFLDTEFMEDGKSIELLSIGVVCDDGREFYAVNAEADRSHANAWVQVHVLPHLGEDRHLTRAQIRDELLDFLTPKSKVEVWGYYADYDWVLFSQLFGKMVDLPSRFPMFCMDLKQLSVMLGSPKHPPQTSTAHNALDDARWHRDLFDFLRNIET